MTVSGTTTTRSNLFACRERPPTHTESNPEQQKFIAWARQHLRDWQQRDAAMLEACKQHQLARECRECIKLGGCVRYACEGQPCREWSGPLPLPMPSHWPEVQRNFGGEKKPRK